MKPLKWKKPVLKVNFKKNTELIIPEEFQNKLDEIPALKTENKLIKL